MNPHSPAGIYVGGTVDSPLFHPSPSSPFPKSSFPYHGQGPLHMWLRKKYFSLYQTKLVFGSPVRLWSLAFQALDRDPDRSINFQNIEDHRPNRRGPVHVGSVYTKDRTDVDQSMSVRSTQKTGSDQSKPRLVLTGHTTGLD